MHRLIVSLCILAVLGLAVVDVARADEASAQLEFRFIGNEAFAITDGEFTLVTDFPYRPGVYGYMMYDLEEVRPKGIVLALITHTHMDHFDFTFYVKTSWSIMGPASYIDAISGYDTHSVSSEEPLTWENILVEPIATPHAEVEHYSYRVTWHGVRMYFVGDTEHPAPLLKEKGLDVAFVTPWLLKDIQDRGAKIDAKKVVVYHHKKNQQVLDYQGRVVPEQGDIFTIPFNE